MTNADRIREVIATLDRIDDRIVERGSRDERLAPIRSVKVQLRRVLAALEPGRVGH